MQADRATKYNIFAVEYICTLCYTLHIAIDYSVRIIDVGGFLMKFLLKLLIKIATILFMIRLIQILLERTCTNFKKNYIISD